MIEPNPIPALRFNTADLPDRLRFDALRAYYNPLFEVAATDETPRDAGASVIAWRLPNIVLSDVSLGPMRITRNPKAFGLELSYLTVRLYRSGHVRGLIGDPPVELNAGEIHVFDSAQQLRLVSSRTSQITAYIPFEVIGYDRGRHPRHIRIPVTSAVGRVLENAMVTLVAQMRTATMDEAPMLSASFVGMLRGLLRLDGQVGTVPREVEIARGEAMRAFIDDHLRDSDLGLTLLQKAFGASRATIFRDFADDGGVSHYILRRRLANAYRDLASMPPLRGLVRIVAEKWGFEDAAHFTRRFREHFGVAPSDVIQNGARPLQNAPALPPNIDPNLRSPLLDWLNLR